jgi:hypothetical protein
MGFTTNLVVTEHSETEWRLVENLVYEGNKDTFMIPAGFITDFASVPRLLWSFFPPTGLYTKAAVLHDFLYIVQLISRKDADGIFKRVMKEAGVGRIKRYLMWKAVRIGGRYAKNIDMKKHGL